MEVVYYFLLDIRVVLKRRTHLQVNFIGSLAKTDENESNGKEWGFLIIDPGPDTTGTGYNQGIHLNLKVNAT